MGYPKIIGEEETLDAALRGVNLARYGDGELSLALGGDCVSQAKDKSLAHELKAILKDDRPGLLVCIPNIEAKNTKEAWAKYGAPRYVDLYAKGRAYGSSFISRPDSAPWIDTPDYWAKARQLWAGRVVILVKGTERSLTMQQLTADGALFVAEVAAPRRDAWAVVDHLESVCVELYRRAHAEWMGEGLKGEAARDGRPVPPPPIVLLCVGATSTVLAARLARQDVHAVDVGHLGMFMRHATAFSHRPADLISPEYQAQIFELRRKQRWGGDGAKHVDAVLTYADALKAETVLDYGCGEGALAHAVGSRRRILGYDPGVKGKDGMPKPCDLVVCTDVLEHVEPALLTNVLKHIHALAGKGAYFVIATRLAKATLPDGRNAHLIVKPPAWWIEQIENVGFTIDRAARDVEEVGTKDGWRLMEPGKELRLWLKK